MRLLSIDPSIVSIGIAVLIDGEYKESYTFRTNDKQCAEKRLLQIAQHFREIGGKYDCAILELPSTFIRQGRYGLKNVHSLFLLHLSIGVIIGGLSSHPDLKIKFVKVGDWKGKVSKRYTQAYAKDLIGKDLNTHEADAFMMATNWLSREKYNREVAEETQKSQK